MHIYVSQNLFLEPGKPKRLGARKLDMKLTSNPVDGDALNRLQPADNGLTTRSIALNPIDGAFVVVHPIYEFAFCSTIKMCYN